MKLSIDGLTLSRYETRIVRACSGCSKEYSIHDYMGMSEQHFYRPVNYKNGCERNCLECWLGVSELEDSLLSKSESLAIEVEAARDHSHWYDVSIYQTIDQGDLCATYSQYFDQGCHLAILPLSRLVTDRSIFLPNGVMIYPQGRLNLSSIKFSNKQLAKSASSQISASGVKLQELNKYPLLVVPLRFAWDSLLLGDHQGHMEMIVTISEIVDCLSFDLINYMSCKLEHLSSETKPASPGQLSSKSMMSAAVLVKSGDLDSVLLAGAAFTHIITKGLGLDLRQPEWDSFPASGGVGITAAHALSLYSQMLQVQSATSKFVQALSLIEFLAYPKEYQQFKKVKTVVSRYMADDLGERKRILDRFEALTSKVDEVTSEQIGLRTRIVHIGSRLEQLVKSRREREEIFAELDSYIRKMIDHMIEHSHMTWDEYEALKASM
ncbi:hypothetical protein PSH61_19840 [Pseudomonas rhodesiae]|uniref:hypothetical protein n=1 Tax=Pseudomonas TaxID=286 RepID=UPI00273552E5|nr:MULTISPECIES: hypothetical protein [Pseudomonas]MEA1031545.1 hypothetical protein [Pseudomonas sp. N-137]WLI28058.1 hypothetical protein PSH61_19840 [Pseudomonas rhodesiae]